MKIRSLLFILFAITLVSAPRFVNTATAQAANGIYTASLISPTSGQVLYPGQKVRVEWTANLPDVNLEGCEMEVWLSLDGGKNFLSCITPILDPKARFFYWIVPNMPTNEAVLDIRFGCDGWYPECYSPQSRSQFSIATTAGTLY